MRKQLVPVAEHEMVKAKKMILASVTAAAMATAMLPAMAFAAENHETNVSYTVSESYSWTVPANVTFAQNADTDTQIPTDEVTVSSNIIKAGTSTQISLASSNLFKVTSSEGAERSFTVGKDSDNAFNAGDAVLTVASGTGVGNQALTFKLQQPANGVAKQAGVYSGTVTFEAKNVSNN